MSYDTFILVYQLYYMMFTYQFLKNSVAAFSIGK